MWRIGCALAFLLAACQGKPMRTPIIYSAEGVDPYERLSDARRSARLPIFYATDRAPLDFEEEGEYYAQRRGGPLLLGTAAVKLGEAGESWQQLHAQTMAGEPLEAKVESVEEYGALWSTLNRAEREQRGAAARKPAERFAREINRALAGTNNRDIVIYVHGFNTTYETTFNHTALIAHYLAGDAVTLAFSWPTRDSVWGYVGDKVESYRSVRDLRVLLEFLAAETDVRRIHLFSYSAGAPIVSQALLELRLMHLTESAARIKSRVKIGRVIYAAPDQDLETFKYLFLDRIHEMVEVFTLYTSSQDTSFGLGRTFLYRDPRLGRPEEGLNARERQSLRDTTLIYFIDVTDAEDEMGKSALGHMYWYQNPWVITDLILNLRFGLSPAERGLVRDDERSIWGFPDDYPERVMKVARKVAGARPGVVAGVR